MPVPQMMRGPNQFQRERDASDRIAVR